MSGVLSGATPLMSQGRAEGLPAALRGAGIRPPLSWLCDPKCSLSFSGPKGEAKSQVQVGGQSSLRLYSLISSCSLQHLCGFGDFKALSVQSFICFLWIVPALGCFLKESSGTV